MTVINDISMYMYIYTDYCRSALSLETCTSPGNCQWLVMGEAQRRSRHAKNCNWQVDWCCQRHCQHTRDPSSLCSSTSQETRVDITSPSTKRSINIDNSVNSVNSVNSYNYSSSKSKTKPKTKPKPKPALILSVNSISSLWSPWLYRNSDRPSGLFAAVVRVEQFHLSV